MSQEFEIGDKVRFIPELVEFVKKYPNRASYYDPEEFGVPGSVILNDAGRMDEYITDYPYVTIKRIGYREFVIEEDTSWTWDNKWIEKYHDILSEAEEL